MIKITYLRRWPCSEKPELRVWQEIPELIAMNIAKCTTPISYRKYVTQWLDRGLQLGNEVVQVRKCSAEMAARLMMDKVAHPTDEDEALARQAGGEAVPA